MLHDALLFTYVTSFIAVVPGDDVVSIGENSWNILYISEHDEEAIIRQFVSNGGIMLNPIYSPPATVRGESYEQSVEHPSHVVTALKNVRNSFTVSPPVADWEKGIFSCLAWNSLGTKVAMCFVDSTIHIYNIKKQMWEETVLSDASMSGIRQLCWKPGSRDTVTVATRNGVFVWSTIGDLESQSLFQVSAEANVLSAQYSPNGEYSPHVTMMCRYLCVIRKDDYRVYLYNTCDYQLVNTLGSLTCLPRKVLFSPDCQLLVVLSECGCGGAVM